MSDTDKIQKIITQIPIVDLKTKKCIAIIYPETVAEAVLVNDHTLDEELQVMANNTIYTNEKQVPTNIGGIHAGESFNSVNIKDIMTKLLYPTANPMCELTPSIPEGCYEKGIDLSVTFIANIIGSTDNIDSFLIHSITQNEDTEHSVTLPTSEYTTTISETTELYSQVNVVGTDNMILSTIKSKALKYIMVNPLYHGILTTDDISLVGNTSGDMSSDIVSKLTKSLVQVRTCELSFNSKDYTLNQYLVFFVPTDWGDNIRIYDQNGFIITNSFKCTPVTINGVQGNMWYTGPVAINDFNITISVDE